MFDPEEGKGTKMYGQGYCIELGCSDYGEILDLQLRLNQARQRNEIPDTFLLLEHRPCLTIGRKGGWNHILAGSSVLAAQNIKVFESNRGGDITYHGPGQLICYPVVALTGAERDLHAFARKMEEMLIRTLRQFGLASGRKARYPGVWIGDAKIGAMGMAVRKWVTMHGVALNVCPDLRHFDLITPCGISGLGVTSMQELTGMADMADVRRVLKRQLEGLFQIRLEDIGPDKIKEMTQNAAKTALADCTGAKAD